MYVSFTISGKKKFTFRGCGWKPVDLKSLTEEKKAWILVVADLFEQIFGGDFYTIIIRNMAPRWMTQWYPICWNTVIITVRVNMVVSRSLM